MDYPQVLELSSQVVRPLPAPFIQIFAGGRSLVAD